MKERKNKERKEKMKKVKEEGRKVKEERGKMEKGRKDLSNAEFLIDGTLQIKYQLLYQGAKLLL